MAPRRVRIQSVHEPHVKPRHAASSFRTLGTCAQGSSRARPRECRLRDVHRQPSLAPKCGRRYEATRT